MDREARRAAIHGVAKSRTRLSNWTELNWIESTIRTGVSFLLGFPGGSAGKESNYTFTKEKKLHNGLQHSLSYKLCFLDFYGFWL